MFKFKFKKCLLIIESGSIIDGLLLFCDTKGNTVRALIWACRFMMSFCSFVERTKKRNIVRKYFINMCLGVKLMFI